jgi:hypothetical protein
MLARVKSRGHELGCSTGTAKISCSMPVTQIERPKKSQVFPYARGNAHSRKFLECPDERVGRPKATTK